MQNEEIRTDIRLICCVKSPRRWYWPSSIQVIHALVHGCTALAIVTHWPECFYKLDLGKRWPAVNKVTLLEQERTIHLESLDTNQMNCERLKVDFMKQIKTLKQELSLSRLKFEKDLEEQSLMHSREMKEKEIECEKKDLLVKQLEERLDLLNQGTKSLYKELGVLRLELDKKDDEARLAVEHLRNEFKDCSAELLKLQDCKTQLEKDVVIAKQDLETCRNEKEFQVRVLSTKLDKLDELILTKDALIQQMRTDEFQRANILHSAVISYVQSVPRYKPLQFGSQLDTPSVPQNAKETE